jgi:protein tyrosine phosphatase
MKTKQSSTDFWRMVWELNANCIVMLTKVFDFMRVMCVQYWPVTHFTFGEIYVETLDTTTYAHFVSVKKVDSFMNFRSFERLN